MEVLATLILIISLLFSFSTTDRKPGMEDKGDELD